MNNNPLMVVNLIILVYTSTLKVGSNLAQKNYHITNGISKAVNKNTVFTLQKLGRTKEPGKL